MRAAIRRPSRARSQQMSLVRARGNKSTELKFAAFLRARKITGWRRHAALPGRPDFSFPRERLAVFLDGCFWHGCPKCGRIPKSNVRFWTTKIQANSQRDRRNVRELRKAGWRVVRVWEHALRRELTDSSRVLRTLHEIRQRA
jgi:DNA mismatch endonuclease (patch repair protein)